MNQQGRMIYDAQFFINLFERIPAHHWVTTSFTEPGVKDAFGHCGEVGRTETTEGRGLSKLFKAHNLGVISVQWSKTDFMRGSPRENILAALRWILTQEEK